MPHGIIVRHSLRIAHVLLLLLLPVTVASAQTFRGTILGTVTDSNGALVSGAKVTIKNAGTGLERTTTTDDAGNYTVPSCRLVHTKCVSSRQALSRQSFQTSLSKLPANDEST